MTRASSQIDRPERLDDPATAAKWTCWVVGLVLMLLAILGFAGGDTVLEAFTVNAAHNTLLLLSGVVLFSLGFASEAAARTSCWVFAGLFALVMVLGFAGAMWLIQLLNLNMAGNWLYLVVSIVLITGAGLSHTQLRTRTTPATTPGSPGTPGNREPTRVRPAPRRTDER